MAKASLIEVEVVYALPAKQCVVTVMIAAGSTLKDTILSSKILDLFPEINLDDQIFGVFGQIKPLTYQPIAGDRIEIYRPLSIDPMIARRIKANNNSK